MSYQIAINCGHKITYCQIAINSSIFQEFYLWSECTINSWWVVFAKYLQQLDTSKKIGKLLLLKSIP